MLIFFLILILLLSIVLGLVILIQNPKGGGLASNFAGFSNQFMGVKQTTDVLEKRHLDLCSFDCAAVSLFWIFYSTRKFELSRSQCETFCQSNSSCPYAEPTFEHFTGTRQIIFFHKIIDYPAVLWQGF